MKPNPSVIRIDCKLFLQVRPGFRRPATSNIPELRFLKRKLPQWVGARCSIDLEATVRGHQRLKDRSPLHSCPTPNHRQMAVVADELPHANGNRQQLGHCCRFRVEQCRAAMCRSIAVQPNVTLKGSFPIRRTHTPDPKRKLRFGKADVQERENSGARSRLSGGASLWSERLGGMWTKFKTRRWRDGD